MSKKLILLSFIAIGVLFSGQAVLADSASLSVLPATGEKIAGAVFSANIQVNPAGNIVCVVKGTLVFNNLTCQNISIASGLMAQVSPTCASPSFTLGIPNCTTTAQNILSVSAKGATAGDASLSFSGAKVIGVGVNVAFVPQSGTYTITAVAPPKPVVPKPVVPKTVQPKVEQPTTTQPEEVQPTEQPAVVEDIIPREAATGGVLATVSKSLTPQMLFNIMAVLVVILVGFWAFNKFIKKNKKQPK